MKRGPKPKPAAKAVKQGNPSKRANRLTRRTEPVDPTIPAWLGAPARQIWASLMPSLLALGILLETDRPAFARYCDHVARWMSLRQDVEKKGETYETRSKHGRMLRVNPQFLVMMQLEEKITKLEDRFGLSPVQREAILSRMTDPASARLLDPAKLGGDHVANGSTTGIPSTPIGRLSPDAFRRPSGNGGSH